MSAPLTGFYAGLLVLLLLVLAGRVSLLRGRHGVSLGHGNEPALVRAIRVHGNAVEWVLPMLVLFLAAELDGANHTFLHACGLLFILSRIAHAVGLSRTSRSSSGRFWGTAGSYIAIVLLAGWNISAFARMALRYWR